MFVRIEMNLGILGEHVLVKQTITYTIKKQT